jgi:hypothetical protein
MPEYSSFTRTFDVQKKPDFAGIRIDSMGVCGIFINGTFLEAITGRYANRIAFFEFTSLINEGENTVKLVLGGHYYQPVGMDIFNRSGAIFSSVAAEITLKNNNDTTTIVTDGSWECDNSPLTCFSEVTNAEYDHFWLSAALWEEQKDLEVNSEIKSLLGEKYLSELSSPHKYVEIDNVIYSGEGFKAYDLGKVHVGYLEIEYAAKEDSSIDLCVDYNETADDLEANAGLPLRLKITEPLSKGKHTLLVLRRRAFRFLKYVTSTDVEIKSIRLIKSTKPYSALGYFNCEDELLNKIWQVGKYTLLINKHHEYESCPRNEMKFFSGDAIIEALVDYYAFGDGALVDASLSLSEIDTNLGIRHNRYDRNVSLWDYPAWRILIAYNHYRYFNDAELIKKYYNELKLEMLWLTDKLNSRHLVYQYPCFSEPMYAASSPVEYNSSPDRLGEKPLLNALVYKCLLCMGELAALVNDADEKSYFDLAKKVKDAVNEHLYSEEKGAYLDLFNTEYIPADGNAVAVLFGIADEERAKTVLDTLKNECWTPYGTEITNSDTVCFRDRLHLVSPVMNTYEAEARFIYGDEENALTVIRNCWGGMIAKGAESFWEFAPSDENIRWPIAAHGWAAGCTYLLSAFVLGIRPDGYKKFSFTPAMTLKNYSGLVPTPYGDIAVKNENGKLTVVMPKDVELTFNNALDVKIIKY